MGPTGPALMRPILFLSVFLTLTTLATSQVNTHDSPLSKTILNHLTDQHVTLDPISPLLRQADQDFFSIEYINPQQPTASIPSQYTVLQEVSSWTDLTVFTQLLRFVREFPGGPIILLAPVQAAFFELLQRIQPGKDFFAADPNTIVENLEATLVDSGLLDRILSYHIVPGDLTEQQLADFGSVPTASGAVPIDFSNLPILGDKDEFVAAEPKFRFYRSIEVNAGPRFRILIINKVLLPFNLTKELEGSTLVTGPPTGSPLSFIGQIIPQDFLRFEPWRSFQNFLAERVDLQILHALFIVYGRSIAPALVPAGRSHFFAPTNDAFIQLVKGLLGDDVHIDPKDPVPGIVGSVTTFLDTAKKISRLPSLPEILLYHIVPTEARYESLVGAGTLRTLYPNATLSVIEDDVVDNDPSRGPAGRIASFPTFQGWVTIVDSVLLPFDVSIAKAVIDANIEVPEPTAEAIESDEESDDGVCFAGDATVRLSNGRKVRMTDLQAGDDIHVDVQGKTSKIYLFTHRSPAVARFVELETGSGRSIRLTKGHYVYSKGRMVAAGSVRIGDSLDTENGEEQVVRVGSVVRRGIFAPHSVHGDLMVDGVRVSSYTMAIAPRLAHAVLAPVRAAAVWGGFKEPLGRLLYDGVKESWLNRGSWIFGGAQRY